MRGYDTRTVVTAVGVTRWVGHLVLLLDLKELGQLPCLLRKGGDLVSLLHGLSVELTNPGWVVHSQGRGCRGCFPGDGHRCDRQQDHDTHHELGGPKKGVSH